MADDNNIVFLNGRFMPMSEAKISPMDRGFLFGDGIYEVVPSYNAKLVGFGLHIQRMQDGLNAIGIKFLPMLLKFQRPQLQIKLLLNNLK